MKKYIYGITFVVLVASVFYFKQSEEHSEKVSEIIVATKSEEGIKEQTITKLDLPEDIKAETTNEENKKQRNPASLQKHAIYKNRETIGPHPDLLDRAAINTFNRDWKKFLGHDLLKFQQNGTKVIIEEEKQLVLLKKEESRLVEQVVVTYFSTTGKKSSFRALVDSENGHIIQTWDRIIHEDIRTRPVTLNPTGTL